MRILAVHHTKDRDRLATLPDWEVWETDQSIAETYFDIARTALAEGWDTDTIVVQDDIRFLSPPTRGKADIVSYGTWGDHACPRAIAASSLGWSVLASLWHGEVRLCEGFMKTEPLVEAYDIIEHLETPGFREMPRMFVRV